MKRYAVYSYKHMSLIKKSIISAALFFSAAPFSAFAVACSGQGLCNPLGYDSLTTFLQKLLQIVAQIGFPVIVLFMVYIGFLFIAAEGNPDKIKQARSYLFWAVVGALIVLGAEALSLAIQATVNQLSQGL